MEEELKEEVIEQEQEQVDPELERQAKANLSQLRLECARVAQCDGTRGSLLKTNNLLRYVLFGEIQEVNRR